MLQLFRRMEKALFNRSKKTSSETAKSPPPAADIPVAEPPAAKTPTAAPETTPAACKIIPRSAHRVSRKDISINALKVMSRLIRHGYRGYLVGGCVRDLMLGRKPKDFDVVTDARPEQLRALFRNCRLIGRRFRLAHVFFQGGEIIEVSTFRQGVVFDPDSDGPLTGENTYGTPAADAFRRDITINGLFYDLQTFAIYDYVGGMTDLRDRVVRIIGDPCLRIKEDPIRMIRAIRHAAGTGFAIEPGTLAAIKDCAGLIVKANPSRLRDEFLRELTDGHAAKSIDCMAETGLLSHLVPVANEVWAMEGERAKTARAHLGANLRALDQALGARKDLPLPVILAAFLGPLARMRFGETPAADGRGGQSRYHYFLRDDLKPILRRLGIGKADAEQTVMLLVGLKTIHHALSKGSNLPRTLTSKNYFAGGLLLYQLETAARCERLPHAIAEQAQASHVLLFQRPPRHRGSRRRRGRPDRPAKPAPAGAEQKTADPNRDLRFDPSTLPDRVPALVAKPKNPPDQSQ